MARSKKDGVHGGAHRHGHAGKEYWSSRPCKMVMADWGNRLAKMLTHRAERRELRSEVATQIAEMEF